MKEADQIKLAEYVAKADFSADIYRDIFGDLVAKHSDESMRQHTIRAIIEIWMRRYPKEVRAFEEQMRKTKETRNDKFASAGINSDQRTVFKIPESLWNRLSSMLPDPAFLAQSNPMTEEEKDEWAWFIREFPLFVIPEKI